MAINKIIDIECSFSAFFGYAYYKSGLRLLQRLYIKNLSAEDILSAELIITSSPDFIIPYKKTLNLLPYESTVEADISDLKYNGLLEKSADIVTSEIFIKMYKENKILFETSLIVTLLPYDIYCGTAVSPELLSCYIRPKQPETAKLLKTAAEILKNWKLSYNISGYEGNDKNAVRLIAAAIYRAVQMTDTAKDNAQDYEKPLSIRTAEAIFSLKKANTLEIAALFCSCIEAAGLNAVIAIGNSSILCGIWLTDNCFLESFSDDITELKKRSAEDINDIAVIDIENLFAGGKQNFVGAEKTGRENIEGLKNYSYVIDIKRCNAAGYKPLPARIKTSDGYEIVPEEPVSLDEMPKEVKKGFKILRVKPQLTKDKQWERRLLDLSLKNSLLNFVPSGSVLHIMSVSAEKTAAAMLFGGEFNVLEMPAESFVKIIENKSFNSSPGIKSISELINLEIKSGRLRIFLDVKDLTNSLNTLYRKDRTSLEETGASTLYAAAGFLKWQYAGDKEGFKYAPLILLPITLIKKAGGKGFIIKMREDEFQFNTTLLEFLKQEFGIELRGLDELKGEELDISSVIVAVKKQILGFKGWEVVEDVYLASLSFSRFLMWNDLRTHGDIFKKNKLITSLIENRLDVSLINKVTEANSDDKEAKPLLLPISADYSQFKALALSDKGVSFVLHGPPGTGKSQTITNIIANAIGNGKRVLFVAEKMAALSVVKKRLDDIGLGDFCLELHSKLTAKTDVAERLIKTLDLKNKTDSDFSKKNIQINELKEMLFKPMQALHKKRSLGLSIYEGILKIEDNAQAPDIMDIESPFFDNLTPEKLKNYENLISELICVSRECGQIYRSPFEDAKISSIKEGLSLRVATSIKVLQEEARHLKVYANLSFERLGNKVRVLSRKKLVLLSELCQMLLKPENPYIKIFGTSLDIDAISVLNDFTFLYKTFEEQEDNYNTIFKQKVELPAEPSMLREELEIFKDNINKSRPLKLFIKKMEHAAKNKINPEDYIKYFEIVLNYYETKLKMSAAGDSLSSLLTDGKNERVNYNQVADLLLQLKKLYDLVQQIFVQYDHPSFNKVLKNLFSEYPSAILKSYLNAFNEFEKAEKIFFDILKIEKDYSALDEDYSEFLSLKASALLENIDLLPGWCRYNALSKKFKDEGLSFAITPLKEGKIAPETILSCFNKKVYTNFIEREVSEDEDLSKFIASAAEEKIDKFKILCDEYEKSTRQEIYLRLAAKLPNLSTEGSLSIELMQLQRAYKSNMRGYSLRNLFTQIKNLFTLTSPCLLMSPTTVAQYLEAEADMFDLVVFDEASQMPTCDALGAIARGKTAIIVGDPKQLPPTAFFNTDYTDEENLQSEDLESILEDCLALGLPEKYLMWHYRSKHESLIAFSNALYYGNKLYTFPSPDALQSKVHLKYIENGIYDRGNTKQNPAEADSLVAEVIKRLKENNNKGQSIGIVTFSLAQQVIIENKMSDALIKYKLENAAYDRKEPIFVKNLENVQGDERDVILFSICYGPDKFGKLSLNFGPVNQANGWRRLNVAASRAREEMVIFSSITSAMIDLSKNNSKGVAGIKAFLEFAAGGKSMLAVKSSFVENRESGIGKFIAADLASSGLECRYNLGVSDFKIDVAVIDPRDKNKFILAVICDSRPIEESGSIKDAEVLQVKTLKRLDWNVVRIWTLNYFNNPKREIKKIKMLIDKLCGKNDEEIKYAKKFLKPYAEANIKSESVLSSYLTNKENETVIISKLMAIVDAEQPISKELLIKKCLFSYGIVRTGNIINEYMEELIKLLDCKAEVLNGITYYMTDDSMLKCDTFRVEQDCKIKRQPQDISPYEYVAAAKSILSERLSLYISDLIKEIADVMGLGKVNPDIEKYIRFAIDYGTGRNILSYSVNNMVTL